MKLHATALSFLAGAIGVMAWHGNSTALLLLPLLAWIWSKSPTRLAAFTALFLYYAGAGRGMLDGAGMFYADANEIPAWWIGVVMWPCSSALLASVWAFGWGARWRAARLCAVLLVISVPPVGLIGWANPLTAAGILFPGLGWFGLCALLLLLGCIASFPRLAALAPLLVLSAITQAYAVSPGPNALWQGIDTQLGSVHTLEGEFARLTSLQQAVSAAAAQAPDGARIVLPEMVGGDWSVNGPWWDALSIQLRKKNQVAFLGAHWPAPSGRGYVNGIVTIGSGDGAAIEDRVPVPISMWKPWADDGATASWFGAGTTIVAGKRVGHLICYEQILIWPVLATFARSPDIVIATSNMWWAKNTSVPAIQHEAVEAWSKLFSIQVVGATNL